MTTVKLYTNRAEFVAEIKMPPFLTPPAVLIWGSRVFTLWPRGGERDWEQADAAEGDGLRYREAFAWWAP